MPDRETFVAAYRAVERLIEARYGIPVIVSDVPTPFTGDLDGAEIRVDYDLDPEDALFIIVHLFGHTVQWNVSPEARAIAKHPGPWDADHLAPPRTDERGACRHAATRAYSPATPTSTAATVARRPLDLRLAATASTASPPARTAFPRWQPDRRRRRSRTPRRSSR